MYLMPETRQQIQGDIEKGEGLSRISAVANYFIVLSKKDKRPLSNLAMQKMVYFAYGWVLVMKEERLFYDRIEAWQYGPVIPSLYHQLKHYGRDRITKEIVDYDYRNDKFRKWILTKGTSVEEIVRKVWNKYSTLSSGEMVDLTHNPGTPWHETITNKGFNSEIGDELIRNHFESINKSL